MSNTFDKLSVLDSFIEEVNSYLPEIEANLARLAQSPGDMEAIEETYRRTHTIGGSASMMDFPGLAHVAHGMEDILGDVLDGLASLDVPTLGLLQRSLARMHQLVQGIRNGVDEDAVIAEDDADYVQYRALLDSSAQQAYDEGPTHGQLQAVSIPLPADGLTEGGVPLLWPYHKRFGFPPNPHWRFRTGDWPEYVIVYSCMLLVFLCIWQAIIQI